MTDTELKRRKAICDIAGVKEIDDVSDGFHTFRQLYYQRMMLFATIVKQNKDKAWKSLRHEDGELCFGGGWFIVGIDTPEGSYTYHYEDNYFSLFDCEELDRGKHWDGHTEKDVTRLLSLPSTQPCEDKLKEIAEALSEKMCYMNMCPNERDIILGYLGVKCSSKNHCNTDCWNEKCESYHYETRKQPKPCEGDPRADVYYLAEKIGIHRLYALVVELRGEPESCGDAVSRQAAIDIVHKIIYGLIDLVDDGSEEPMSDKDKLLLEVNKAICNGIKDLPSAQPERKCLNCGRTVNNGGWYADGRTRCPIEEHYALPKDGYCHLWEKRNVTDDDYPERREE